ncbi:MAG TPA: SRPBCC domain-containing protein [Mycobacteriales bacterium]|nr:SRPBCC domain-containing protein [Mycobacteriales bacterium]
MTTNTYRVWIKATPQQVWDAIVDPAINGRYGYGMPATYDLRAGGAYEVKNPEEMVAQGFPAQMITGEVISADAPKKLVQTWAPNFGPETVAEGPRTLTHEIEEQLNGVVLLTVTIDVTDAPTIEGITSGVVTHAGGGLPMLLSDLKTYLETGSAWGPDRMAAAMSAQ